MLAASQQSANGTPRLFASPRQAAAIIRRARARARDADWKTLGEVIAMLQMLARSRAKTSTFHVCNLDLHACRLFFSIQRPPHTSPFAALLSLHARAQNCGLCRTRACLISANKRRRPMRILFRAPPPLRCCKNIIDAQRVAIFLLKKLFLASRSSIFLLLLFMRALLSVLVSSARVSDPFLLSRSFR